MLVHSNAVSNTKSVADENVPKILQELEITRKELEEIKVTLFYPIPYDGLCPPPPECIDLDMFLLHIFI